MTPTQFLTRTTYHGMETETLVALTPRPLPTTIMVGLETGTEETPTIGTVTPTQVIKTVQLEIIKPMERPIRVSVKLESLKNFWLVQISLHEFHLIFTSFVQSALHKFLINRKSI